MFLDLESHLSERQRSLISEKMSQVTAIMKYQCKNRVTGVNKKGIIKLVVY